MYALPSGARQTLQLQTNTAANTQPDQQLILCRLTCMLPDNGQAEGLEFQYDHKVMPMLPSLYGGQPLSQREYISLHPQDRT